MDTSSSSEPTIRLMDEICVSEPYGSLPGAQKPRQVFALLALQAGHFVSAFQLMREMWNEPPSSCVTTLQVYISSLRRKLEGLEIITGHKSYKLAVPRHEIDVHQFVSLANAAMRAEDAEEIVCHSRAALALLPNGEIFPCLDLGPSLAAWEARIENQSRSLRGRWADALLRLGRYDEVADMLTKCWFEDQSQEGFAARLMIALYALDRRQEALDVFMKTQRTLREVRGLDPTNKLVTLQRLILTGQELRPTLLSG